jgi:hypothetical protein
MKNQNLQLLGLMLCCTVLYISCKKHTAAPENIIPVEVPQPESSTKTYMPAQLKTSKMNSTYYYTESKALGSIGYDNGDSTQLKFSSSGKPVSTKRYKNKVLVFASLYDVDSKGFITGAEQYTVNKGSEYVKTGAFTLSYNSDGKVDKVSYFNKSDVFLYEQQYSYGSGGNLSAQTSSEASLLAEYNYDAKNALFKNVGYAWLYALEKENPLFLSVINNVQQCSYPGKTTSNQTSTYTYNDASFPKSVTNTVAGVKESITVVYK